AVEDGYLDQNFATAQIGHFAMWGIAHLSRGDNETYAKYIDRIATTKGVADTCARTVKVADLLDNLHGRPHPPNPSLRRRYEKALATLTAAMEKRGEPVPSRPGESEA